MATGFERDIECRALGAWPCLIERKSFCVGLPRTVVIPTADDAAVLDDEGPDHRIRAGLAPALRRKTKGQDHEMKVLCGGSHRFLRAMRGLRGCRADFIFRVFIASCFTFDRGPETLRAGRERLDAASAKAAWAAASRAMGMR